MKLIKDIRFQRKTFTARMPLHFWLRQTSDWVWDFSPSSLGSSLLSRTYLLTTSICSQARLSLRCTQLHWLCVAFVFFLIIFSTEFSAKLSQTLNNIRLFSISKNTNCFIESQSEANGRIFASLHSAHNPVYSHRLLKTDRSPHCNWWRSAL